MLEMGRVLIVGAGATAAVAARRLRREGVSAERIVVWEALASVGGRFRSEMSSKDGGLTDTGAQYLTRVAACAVGEQGSAGDDMHEDIYKELQQVGLLRKMSGNIQGTRAADGDGESYICEKGMQALVEYMLTEAGVQVCCLRRLLQLKLVEDEVSVGFRTWEASFDGASERFGAVVLTQPVPQMLPLFSTGEASELLDRSGFRGKLRNVQFSSRYAMSLFFDECSGMAQKGDKARLDELLPFVGKYVGKDEDPDIVFISYDSAKRGAGIPSLMVHSSVPYGIKQMKQGASLQAVQAEMLESLRRVMPALPAPEEVAIYPWEHSQVRYPLDLPDGAACVVLNDVQGAASASLVLAGDAFSSLGSRFDGCAQSGEHAARALLGASRTQR